MKAASRRHDFEVGVRVMLGSNWLGAPFFLPILEASMLDYRGRKRLHLRSWNCALAELGGDAEVIPVPGEATTHPKNHKKSSSGNRPEGLQWGGRGEKSILRYLNPGCVFLDGVSWTGPNSWTFFPPQICKWKPLSPVLTKEIRVFFLLRGVRGRYEQGAWDPQGTALSSQEPAEQFQQKDKKTGASQELWIKPSPQETMKK